VSKTYREYAPTQGFLLPPSPLEWLPPNHLAYFVLDTIKTLDLSAITLHYERELRGYPPHNPRMMVALLLYDYCVGVPSSRRIARKTHEDVAFRVLAGNTHPDHTCVSEFRRIHLQALAALFVDVLRTCCALGLVKLGHVALDGTKVEANASKHKAMSYERMKQEEERLTKKVVELLTSAQGGRCGGRGARRRRRRQRAARGAVASGDAARGFRPRVGRSRRRPRSRRQRARRRRAASRRRPPSSRR